MLLDRARLFFAKILCADIKLWSTANFSTSDDSATTILDQGYCATAKDLVTVERELGVMSKSLRFFKYDSSDINRTTRGIMLSFPQHEGSRKPTVAIALHKDFWDAFTTQNTWWDMIKEDTRNVLSFDLAVTLIRE
ncbi:hypothetical protein LTR66_016138 [Elasticomyces elasticus]|nr:hypothetical protein LTR66_016138 [Elasticomyces elasticus]